MKKIMIVDDEAVITLGLQQRLSTMGYEVVGMCHSGDESLEKARRLKPDLILMDIKIPGNLDGIAAAGIVKAELDIPVIFLTAFAEDQIIKRAKQAQPYGYIVKPVQDLELKAAVEVALYKNDMEQHLRESEQQYRSMIDAMGDAIHVVNRDLRILTANPLLIKWNKSLGLETDILNLTVMEVFPFLSKTIIEEYHLVFANGNNLITEERTHVGDRLFFTETRKIPIFEKGIVQRVITVIRDITQRKQNEASLQKARDELERRVEERTRELEVKTHKLEEVNTALKVLLTKRDEDKKNLEERVLSNIKELVLPYLEKLKAGELDERKISYLDVLRTNLNEIISPFTHKLSSKYLNLTPAEIRVADLVRQGKKTKEIAEFLNLSFKTIERQRENIRRKIGIKNKKVHLQSHLLSFH
ncbi:response regulator [Thermodesulfobacteriota bacterium]